MADETALHPPLKPPPKCANITTTSKGNTMTETTNKDRNCEIDKRSDTEQPEQCTSRIPSSIHKRASKLAQAFFKLKPTIQSDRTNSQ